ncbi:hypothetical protein B5D80_04740 [Micromonospora wenchangensis]|uniref:Uncharacterized protein n=1 Tax=Micromonospora wenchangensis TaxID=1185415 RepID=A0A246RRK4_9ACTN|nr:hypothetical protein B5D80_04740 [Micromonospora wenchangensis]
MAIRSSGSSNQISLAAVRARSPPGGARPLRPGTTGTDYPTGRHAGSGRAVGAAARRPRDRPATDRPATGRPAAVGVTG